MEMEWRNSRVVWNSGTSHYQQMENLLLRSEWTDIMRDLVEAVVADDLIALQNAVPSGDRDEDDLAGALCAAVLLRRYRCIEALVNLYGADPLRSYANRNSIHWAIDRDDLQSLEILVRPQKRRMTTVNSGSEVQRSWYEDRQAVDEALFTASWLGNVGSVQLLLTMGANPNSCFFYNTEFLLHCSPLIVACLAPISQHAAETAVQNAETIVQLLVEAGANVGRRCSTGRTPLHWAVVANLTSAVSVLIGAEADVGAQTAGSKQTPLMLAVTFDSFPLVNTLLAAGSCVDDVDSADCTALCYAVDKRNLEMADHLLRNGASPDGAPFQKTLTTPLIMATSIGSREMIILLARWGADINKNSKTRNAFATAVNVNNFGNARLLLKLGADIKLARQLVSDQMTQILIKAGGLPELLRLPEKLRMRELKQLENEMSQPPKLAECCRQVVRLNVQPASFLNIQKLPLPTLMTKYLSFDELV